MHEASLVTALFDQVDRSIAPHPGAIVHRVFVRVGELAGVEPELLRLAYDTLREGRSCASAAIELVSEPAEWQCRACALPIPRGEVLRCPRCEGEARLVRGGEVFLDRLELEVPDV
ncbi:MAG: hydrogenase maturation nickel metallochaperone HypA [Myxococcales bacterium]|nr:hydrogenase maturation nickel metallochaperone HypA [Myxococcales bacterium]